MCIQSFGSYNNKPSASKLYTDTGFSFELGGFGPPRLEPNSEKSDTLTNAKVDTDNDTTHDEGNSDQHESSIKDIWISKTKFRKQQSIKRKENISMIFNYSKVKFTCDMEKVLNRGLNFAFLPKSLDLTQILSDYKRFERNMIWQEYWMDKHSEGEKANIFNLKKTNLPKNYKVPHGLKVFLNSVMSEILDPLNRNKAKPNVPLEEFRALKDLATLEDQRLIVIKQCDKGAGLIILDFDEYVKACEEHLHSTQDNRPYYVEIEEKHVEEAKHKVLNLLEEGLDNGFISKEEYHAMNPMDKKPGKFYCNFKVHKEHRVGYAPPVRPIVSGSGSILENIGQFITFHLKKVANKHRTFIQDTPDFLRKAEDFNNSGSLPENAIVVTLDVSALYTNMEKDESIEAVKNTLAEANYNDISIGFILWLLELMLDNNMFTFNDKLYKQIIGIAMGAKPAPLIADIFMSKVIDDNIFKLGEENIKFFKRFLDDLFLIYIGSTKQLHKFFDKVNELHPHIKFTFNHTCIKSESESEKCDCPNQESIPFLDTSCKIEEGKLIFDLYRKKTDRVQYLLPSSCHPVHCKENIPFSLAMRINRICSTVEDREKRFSELKQMLLSRDYRSGMIDNAIRKAKNISRVEALRPVVSVTKPRRSVFVTSYDPRLPNIQLIQNKHWRSMVSQDKYLGKVFPKPPIVAFKRPRNIRDIIIKAKLPKYRIRPTRQIKGMQTCQKKLCSLSFC